MVELRKKTVEEKIDYILFELSHQKVTLERLTELLDQSQKIRMWEAKAEEWKRLYLESERLRTHAFDDEMH